MVDCNFLASFFLSMYGKNSLFKKLINIKSYYHYYLKNSKNNNNIFKVVFTGSGLPVHSRQWLKIK